MTGTLAGTGPWASGLNSAALVTDSISALSKFSSGTLEPLDMLQISSSALSLATAAAAITGGPITVSLGLAAATIAVVTGPGLDKQINEYASVLASEIADYFVDDVPLDMTTVPPEIVAAAGGHPIGPSIVVRQYDVGTGELSTVELVNRDGTSLGEIGKVSGVARSYVRVAGGQYVSEYGPDGGEPISTKFVPDSTAEVSEHTVPIFQLGLESAQSFLTSVSNGSYSFDGNTAEFVAEVLSQAGLDGLNMSTMFDSSSSTGQFLSLKEWFSHDTYWYNVQGYFDADMLADENWGDFQSFERQLGESQDREEIKERVDIGISSPIAIDLNGDGISTASLNSSNVNFDITGDTIVEHTGWLSATDAFLVRDLNANGRIDDVSEMFGGQAPGQGYAKLAGLDTNRDEVINALDPAFSTLKLWRDRDANGKTDEGELMSLEEAKLTELTLAYDSTARLDNGNLIGENSTALVAGQSRLTADIYFRYEEAAPASAALPVIP